MNLNIELMTGDVNQVDRIDFLLIGHKNPLREQICQETASLFQSVDSESLMFPHKYELLESFSYKWKQVAAIKFRANGKISETQFVRIISPIATALKQPQVEYIGILPPTWRNPQYCAIGVVYSLWCIGYAAASSEKFSVMRELFPDPTNAKFKIISEMGTEYFEAVLKDNCDLMWDFINKLCERQKDDFMFYSYKQLKKIPVTFNVSKISI